MRLSKLMCFVFGLLLTSITYAQEVDSSKFLIKQSYIRIDNKDSTIESKIPITLEEHNLIQFEITKRFYKYYLIKKEFGLKYDSFAYPDSFWKVSFLERNQDLLFEGYMVSIDDNIIPFKQDSLNLRSNRIFEVIFRLDQLTVYRQDTSFRSITLGVDGGSNKKK